MDWQEISGGVTAPRGFRAAGITAGLKASGLPDLALILSDVEAIAAGVFTTSQVRAACVEYCRQQLAVKPSARAILCKSGQANAATGEQGWEDATSCANALASILNIAPEAVLLASTGVIGQRIKMDALIAGIPSLVAAATDEGGDTAAKAIMTTDLVSKSIALETTIGDRTVRIGGMAKGSGMIHPNMATMLGYIISDVKISKEFAHKCLKDAVDISFNMISVDGETSTNDTVLLMANGASNVAIANDSDKQKFEAALYEISEKLAISIARDGEGATKLVTVKIKGASELKQAQDAARLITTSPLIKSAVHGEDPNWGRIFARLGQSGVDAASFEKLSVILQGVEVFVSGKPVVFDRAAARQKLHSENIEILVELNSGNYEATAWGCDLTKRYVEINTEYS